MQTNIDAQLKQDSPTPIVSEFVQSDTLLVVFGGIYGEVGIPPFEFFRITNTIQSSKIFIRDPFRSWYHQGVDERITSISQLSQKLRHLISKSQAKKTVIIGNSAGGYAALLFGHLLQVDQVVAFSPQTFLGKYKLMIHRDTRFQHFLKPLYQKHLLDSSYLDLKNVIPSNSVTNYQIHYCSQNRLDSTHAKHLKNLNAVMLHQHPSGGHALVKHLRDTNQLVDILEANLN